MLELRTREDVEKFVLGATILGTGGGGSPEEGRRLLESCLERDGRIRVIPAGELDREGFVVVPYYVGTIAPTAKTRKRVKYSDPMREAFKLMEETLKGRIVGVAASEIGGGNTSVALAIACSMGLPSIDGDLLGRAAPELHQSTANVFGVSVTPSVMVTSTGIRVVVREVSDVDDYEALARYLSVLEGKTVAVVDTPMTVEEASKVAVSGTLTLCYRLGEAVLNARRRGIDPVKEAARVLGGWKIFEGVVKKYSWRDQEGFLMGEAEVEGVDRWQGHVLKSWIKNEHLMLWIDGKPATMAPDIISFLLSDGSPITNSELREGMRVNVVVAPAPKVWRTPKGLELFGPRRFGFDLDYVPVEELVKGLGEMVEVA